MIATQEEMNDNQIPLHVRDYCAHILIPLNRCIKWINYKIPTMPQNPVLILIQICPCRSNASILLF